jgi:hypothetical protein
MMKASHIPLHKWLLRFRLMTSSMKGVSSHQLHRSLGISYKSAWLTSHRIREAMRAGGRAAPMGGVVEADETYFGEVEEARVSPQRKGSTFVKRGRNGPANNPHWSSAAAPSGPSTSRWPTRRTWRGSWARTSPVRPPAHRREPASTKVGAEFAARQTVGHSAGEYDVHGEVHTGTVEGVFSIFERGMRGVYQHCSEKHLHR